MAHHRHCIKLLSQEHSGIIYQQMKGPVGLSLRWRSLIKNWCSSQLKKCRANDKAIDFYRYIGKSEVEVSRLAWQIFIKPALGHSTLLASIAIIVAAAAISTTAQQDAAHQKRYKQCGAS